VARKKQTPVTQEDAAEAPGCPAARQTIHAYERGGLTPSLKQFLEVRRLQPVPERKR
jgi:DNA-binding XRE family transcriptional regulator